MTPETNTKLLAKLDELIASETDEGEAIFLKSIREHIAALAQENGRLELQALQLILHTGELKQHLRTLQTIANAFASKVTNTTWRTSEPRVVGFKREFEILKQVLKHPDPTIPKLEDVKTLIEEAKREAANQTET